MQQSAQHSASSYPIQERKLEERTTITVTIEEATCSPKEGKCNINLTSGNHLLLVLH